MEKLILRVAGFPDEYLAIKRQANKYLRNNSNIDNSETLNVFHRPWVAPFNWGLMLFKGADKTWIEQFSQRTKKVIPDFYIKFLETINGCFIYRLSLYGLTPSIYLRGQLDRSLLQCLDLTTANNEWIKEYEVDKNYFHFGGRSYSYSENLGYFFDGNRIMAIRKNGEVISEWTSFFDFLFDEINISEKKALKEIPKGVSIIVDE